MAEALDVAAARWPEDRGKPRVLLLHLIAEGARSLRIAEDARVTRRRKAVEETSGSASDVFADGYLEALRKEWPE